MPRCTAAIICSAAGGGYAAPHGCQGGGRGHAEDAAVVDAKVTDQERLCVCVFFFFFGRSRKCKTTWHFHESWGRDNEEPWKNFKM